MQELPTDIVREIPLVRGHKFVKFDDRILVVSSANRFVVAMIPYRRVTRNADLRLSLAKSAAATAD